MRVRTAAEATVENSIGKHVGRQFPPYRRVDVSSLIVGGPRPILPRAYEEKGRDEG
jgi:hypothetical protein